MPGTKDLIDERILVVDALLKTINSPHAEVDSAWGAAVQKRLDALRTGAVLGVPAAEVFAKIRGRFV